MGSKKSTSAKTNVKSSPVLEAKFVAPKLNQESQNPEHTKGWENPCFSYSEALMLLKKGFHVARLGWNGKGMRIFYVRGTYVDTASLMYTKSNSMRVVPYIMMVNVQGELVPWLCSNGDMAADDWQIVGLPEGLNNTFL